MKKNIELLMAKQFAELATAKERGYKRKVEWLERRIETQKNEISQLPPLI